MRRWHTPLYNRYRRIFGRHSIDDPRPIAEKAPYTYFLPTENQLLALQQGDLVKFVFRSHPPGVEWSAERMWATISGTEGDSFIGVLDSQPYDMPQLKPGDPVRFRRTDIIDLQWAIDRAIAPPSPSPRREYWDRCMVDPCILNGKSAVDYLYREAEDMTEPADEFPDSGWRIRGTDKGIADDEQNGKVPEYVALGAVLNRDDTWLALIDEPTGSRFIRDLDTGMFVECRPD